MAKKPTDGKTTKAGKSAAAKVARPAARVRARRDVPAPAALRARDRRAGAGPASAA